jgi:DNA-binding MarR family transcriptional regulator
MSQFSTLFLVASGQGGATADMARRLGVERSTLTRNLALLERDKLIARDPSQRRPVSYKATARGRVLAEQAAPRWRRVQDGIAAALASAAQPDPRLAMRALRAAARAAASSG